MFQTIQAAFIGAKFSPHTRGCSEWYVTFRRGLSVFPAYAGMFRLQYHYCVVALGLPRIRGDVPSWSDLQKAVRGFSRIRGDVP